MHRATISSGLNESGAPHCRQFGGAPGAAGGLAAKATPTCAAPLTRIPCMLTLAASACAGISGSQTHKPSRSGRSLRLVGEASPVTRITTRPPTIKAKGRQATPTNHHRGTRIWFNRDHSAMDARVASSRSRVRRSASRCLSGTEFIVPQKGQTRVTASTTASGALHETH